MASGVDCGGQVFSGLLSTRENALLFTLLGTQCKAVSTAVVQLFLAPGEQGWQHGGCGVLCLVEHHSVCSCFLRLYCVKRARLLWEQELYTPFKYTAALSFFHTFPSDDCQAGINFADETEAEKFYVAVKRHIQSAQDRVREWTQMTHTGCLDVSAGCNLRQEQGRPEISPPVQPESMDVKRDFRPADLDPAMRKLFRRAGLSEEHLRDGDTAEVACRIVNSLGGLEAVCAGMKRRGSSSQTLPRSAAASLSLALRKGPLPAIPPLTRGRTPHQRVSIGTRDLPPWIPPPPSTPAPSRPDRIKKSSSFKPVGSPSDDQPDVLTALRKAFQKKHQFTSR